MRKRYACTETAASPLLWHTGKYEISRQRRWLTQHMQSTTKPMPCGCLRSERTTRHGVPDKENPMDIETVDEYVKKYVESPHGNDKEELAMAALAIRLWEEATGQEYFPPETRKDKERKAQ